MSKKQNNLSTADNTHHKTVSKLGDVWLLNQHRIMCGDSTNPQHVQQLMMNEKADMAFIDPPYNVNYRGHRTIRDKIINDHLTKEQFIEFLNHIIGAHHIALKRGGSLYICHSGNSQALFQRVLEEHLFEIRNQIIWAKNHFSLSFGRYKHKHELLFYCHFKKERDPWYGDRKQTTIWEVPKPAASPLHPTMKPIALIEKALTNSSKKEDIVVDLCGGSGSTLIACEKLGRYARLMEIEPRYVDATIERWLALTKQTALLLPEKISYQELYNDSPKLS